MQTKIIERYFFFGLLLLTIVFSVFIFQPFLAVIVVGASLAIVLYPIYAWLEIRKVPSWLSALLVVIFFIVALCGPLLGIGVLVFNQSQEVYQSIVEGGTAGPFIDSINHSINKVLPEGIAVNMSEKVSEFVSFISKNIANIFSSTLYTIFALILTFLSLFYFLKDGARWRKALIVLSPLSDADDQKIVDKFSQTVNGVVKGSIFIALVQGVLMGAGLAIFGVPNWALWGVAAGVASLIPTVGTALISIPAIIFLLATGHTVQAIGLLVWAMALVGMIDNFLSPIIVGNKVNIPPILILFSVLGGISLMGPVGILIGPLTIGLLYTLISIYRNEFKRDIVL